MPQMKGLGLGFKVYCLGSRVLGHECQFHVNLLLSRMQVAYGFN